MPPISPDTPAPLSLAGRPNAGAVSLFVGKATRRSRSASHEPARVTLDSRKAARSDAKRVDRRGAGAIDGAGGGTCRLDLVRYCAEALVPWCHPTLAPQSARPSAFRAGSPVPGERGVLTLRRRALGAADKWEWDVDLSLRVRAAVGRQLLFGVLVGAWIELNNDGSGDYTGSVCIHTRQRGP
jgi:hypothetical protein